MTAPSPAPALRPLLVVENMDGAYNLFSPADDKFLFVAPLTFHTLTAWLDWRAQHAAIAGYEAPIFPFHEPSSEVDPLRSHRDYAQALAVRDAEGRVRENFVDAVVLHTQESSIPPHDNIMRHDAFSMMTPVVRRWHVLHEGYDSDKIPLGLNRMSLHNSSSGQRIEVALIPRDLLGIYLQARAPYAPPVPARTDLQILRVGGRVAECVSSPREPFMSWAVCGEDIGLAYENRSLPQVTINDIPVVFHHSRSREGTQTERKHTEFLSESGKRLLILY